MTFKEMVAADNKSVFLNSKEFADTYTIVYDGETYVDVPAVLSGLKEKDRRQVLASDHVQGLYLVTSVLHCSLSDLGGKQPEKGQCIKINTHPDSAFFHEFYVSSSVCEMGMLHVELEAIDE